MKIKRTGDWDLARRLVARAPKRLKEATDKAVLQEAQFFRTKIVEGIREQAPGGQAFKPLAPTTLAIRRFRGFKGTKALLVRGDLRNSIAVVKEGTRVFVGVLRTAKSKAGQPLANVAAVHEYGSRPIVVRLTPKARRFLHAAFRRTGLDAPASGRPSIGIAIIRVPARPFLAPVFARHGKPGDVSQRFLERVARNLGGEFGR
ncbi:MAG: phage virion morphogenesis protein [Deltaproteobacteria bacterium]|nr:phage virion morphogenesis protein [Deltaproteobacteria bacterium]